MSERLQIQRLDQRLLLTSGRAVIQDAHLEITGTGDSDQIEIMRDPTLKKRIRVTINGKVFRFALDSVASANIDGGRGDDRIIDRGGWHAPSSMSFNGGAGNDTIESDSWGADHLLLEGGSGSDKLVGTGDGQFWLSGGVGNDTLYGGDADDVLAGGDGADFIDGGRGSDKWTPSLPTSAHDQDKPFSSPIRLTFDRKANDGAAGENDNVRSVEWIAGSAGADTIDASNADGPITIPMVTNGGRDWIVGSRFGDAIGVTNVTLTIGFIGATVYGGGGDDTLTGDYASDSLFGGDGDDIIRSGNGMNGDHIEGGAGDDSIAGGRGADFIDGGSGDDTIDSQGGDDTLIGYAGRDVVFLAGFNPAGYTLPRGVNVRGGSGIDTIHDLSFLDRDDHDPIGFEKIL